MRALLLALSLWIAALVQFGAPLAVDEIEFFRATKWVGEGQVPFRDFWEHHTPLQWLVFGPVASVFANGPGVEAVLAMRWAQMALWLVLVALLVRFTRRNGLDAFGALVLLLASASFVRKAIEYRVDVLGNLAFIGAISLIAFSTTRLRWMGFGALMSMAVLANMRLAPLVVIAALLALFLDLEERRWRWNGRALWMIGGVVPVAALFVGWLFATGAWPAFLDGIIRYNTTSATLLEVDTFFDALLLPVWTLDLGAIAIWIVAIAGVVLALRTIRRPGPLQFMALLLIASIATIGLMEVQYDYHFQIAYLLMLPLATLALARLQRPLWRALVPVVAIGATAIAIVQSAPGFGDALRYQDAVITSADRLTSPGETVFDGAGFALRREPAYRYWFLTTGVRMMAAQGLIDPYDRGDIAAQPPGAIIYDYRLGLYLQSFPDVARYATTHYVPVYRNLWVPGMSAIVGTGSFPWTAPRAGEYEIWVSEALAAHPWMIKPLEYASIEGPLATQYAIPLQRLPRASDDAFAWRVDGVPQPKGTRMLTVRRGSKVELVSTAQRRTGILLVPRGIGTLCIAPAEERVF